MGISDWARKKPFSEKTGPYQTGSRTMLELCEEGRGGVERRSHHKSSAVFLNLKRVEASFRGGRAFSGGEVTCRTMGENEEETGERLRAARESRGRDLDSLISSAARKGPGSWPINKRSATRGKGGLGRLLGTRVEVVKVKRS